MHPILLAYFHDAPVLADRSDPAAQIAVKVQLYRMGRLPRDRYEHNVTHAVAQHAVAQLWPP